MLAPEAWHGEPEPTEFAEVAAFLMTAAEPGAAPGRVAVLTNLLRMGDYSRAELLLIGRKGPFRTMYGPHVRMDVLHEIVKESRRFRRMGPGRYWSLAEYELALEVTDLTETDFYRAGTDNRTGLPQYRVMPEASVREAGEEAVRRAMGLPRDLSRDLDADLGIPSGAGDA